MVSWTLKPITVSIAVTNRASISTLKNVPRIAKVPTTTTTSWSRATSAVAPNFTSRKRNVIQARIPIDPRITSRTACWVSSWLMTGPTVVSVRCPSIGPSAACRAVAIAPNFPVVGRAWLPGLGDGLAPTTPAPPGGADPDGAALAAPDDEAMGLGLGLGDALGLGVGAPLVLGAGLVPGELLGPVDATGA